MANPEAFTTRPNVVAKLTITVGAQNVAANTTSVKVVLQCYEVAEQPSWHLTNDLAFSLVGFGATISGTWSFDFRPTGLGSYTLVNTTRNIAHNTDGTMTLNLTTSIAGDTLGSSSPNATIVLPRIPRGPRVKDNGVWRNTIMYVKDNGTWRIAIPYVKDNGTWRIGGG